MVKSKKSTKKKTPAKAVPAASSSYNKHLICEETGEKVFVATATLKEIRHPPTSQKRKVLVKVPSAKIRTELYDELALCLEDREARLLPKYGGRPWSVLCRVQDDTKASFKTGISPFFRWFRGKLELAALPHILEKIPEPPNFPGYKQTEYGIVRHLVSGNKKKPKKRSQDSSDEEDSDSEDSDSEDEEDKLERQQQEEEYDNLTPEEIQRMESLVGRDVSTLSQVAWDHRNDGRHGAPLPLISIKWICPLRQTFTSRKAAWDHAVRLSKAEQYVDRFLRGRGKTGIPLKPFRPTLAQGLQAGLVRFLRDGLWVVGQEQLWQNDRYRALDRARRREEARQRREEDMQNEVDEQQAKRKISVIDENGEPLRKRQKITGLKLYVAVNRVSFRDQRLKELMQEQKAKKQAAPAPSKSTATAEVISQNDDYSKATIETKKVSKTAAKVGMPTDSPAKPQPTKRKGKGQDDKVKVTYTLTEADRELRARFKTHLSDDEQYLWEVKAETSFQRKLDDDHNAQVDEARRAQQEEEEEESESESEEEEASDTEVAESNDDSDSQQAAEDGVDESDGQIVEGKEKEVSDPANPKEPAADEESDAESSCVELATDEEKQLWEIFHEADMKFWTNRAAKNILKGGGVEATAKVGTAPMNSFDAYQEKVYVAVFGMTPAEYEKHMVKSVKGSERTRYLRELKNTKELKEYGMKQIFPSAHALLEKRISMWVVNPIQRVVKRNVKNAAKEIEEAAAASAASGIPQPSVQQQQTSSEKQTSPVEEVLVAPSVSSFNPQALKPDDASEMKGLLSLSSSAHGAAAAAPVNTDTKPSAISSTPISPSPPLGGPIGVLQNKSDSLHLVVASEQPVTKTESEVEARIVKDAAAIVKRHTTATVSSPEASISADKPLEEEEDDVVEVPVFFPTERYCLTEKQVKKCYDASMEHLDAVMRTVKAKDLTRELADGFDVLRERGRGRYDMELPAFETPEYDFLNDINKAPWMPIVRQVLGDDVVLIHKGCFLSLPDAANQNYHQDGPHLHKSVQKPCHAVNVFTPLVDMTARHGPTEFCLGSHVLGQEDWDKRYIQTPLCKKGVPIMFDYRLGHRGLANTSKDPRPIVYATYARAGDGKEFRDSVNFSRKRYRKLGDFVEKPLSREERNQRRGAQQEETWQTHEELPLEAPTNSLPEKKQE